MYDFLDKHKRAVQIVLAMIALPFAFFGVDFYFRGADQEQVVATVGSQKISRAEFENSLRDHGDRLRAQIGRGFDPAILENPEVRFAIVEQLVNQRLLADEAARGGMRVSDAQLAQFIADLPPFQEDGKFSAERYRDLLRSQNMNPANFEARVRGELTLAPLQEPLTAGSIVAQPSAARYLKLLEQKREIALATVDAEPFVKDAKIADADVKAFYDQNNAAFVTPEQVRFEYAILSPDALARNVVVEPGEIRKHYDDHLATYSTPEERSAAHILIAVARDAKDAEKAAAKKKAEEIAAQVRAQPARFAEIAKAQSQDPGSAPQGGDLGSFGRGTMVKPFEDAVFSAKAGELVGPVESDFGWHVIRVNGVKASTQRAFDQVKTEIETELKRQRAQQKFAAAADQFQNLVYEQADTLAGVGKALDIAVQTSPPVTRSQAQQIALGNAKFAEALFSPTSLQAKRNTDAIEIAANTLMAGRVVDHKPSAPRPFDEVKDEIRRQLERKSAAEDAEKAGRAKLALLEQGKSDKDAGLSFAKPIEVVRNQAGPGLAPDALQRIFQVDAAKLPAYVTAANPRGGFTIYRVSRIIDPPTLDPARLKLAADRMGDQIGREFANAYVASLRARADVQIRQSQLDRK